MHNPALVIVTCSDNEVLIKHGSRSGYSRALVDDAKSRLLGRTLLALKSPQTVSEVVATIGEANRASMVATLVSSLAREGIVVPVGTSFSRALIGGVYAGGATSSGLDGLAKIGILGDGELASRIADGLSAAGLDGEREPGMDTLRSNRDGVGEKETPEFEGNLAGRWERLAETCDIVIAAYDVLSPSSFHEINEAALQNPKPWLLVYIDGSEGVLHPIMQPGVTPCYFELETQSEATLTRRSDYQIFKDELSESEQRVGVFPPYADILCGLTTLAVLRHAANLLPFASDQTIHVDFERMVIDYQSVLKLPRCPACEGLRPAYRHLFM